MADEKVITITVHEVKGSIWDMSIHHTDNMTCDEAREAMRVAMLMNNDPDCVGVRRN